MKADSAIYIYAPHPVFNPVTVKDFDSFEKADSIILYSTLIENLLETISLLNISADKYILLNIEDEQLFKVNESSPLRVKFISADYKNELDNFLTKKSLDYQNNILILSDSIGISPESIFHCFNLLNIEDDSLVIGKSYSGFISFIGYNNIESKAVQYLLESDFDYMKFLAHLDTCPAFINVMERFHRILTVDDFKKLYIELSKKESFAYCSQQMHERFTHLFIEHKDLL